MKIEYTNMPVGGNRYVFSIKYLLNTLRTWYLFHLKFPWVKYKGFVRVMAYTRFAKRKIEPVSYTHLTLPTKLEV